MDYNINRSKLGPDPAIHYARRLSSAESALWWAEI